MTTLKRKEDRRIQRTRQMLQQAFKEITREKNESVMGIWGAEKGLQAMSIQEITERANVNRGTFYLHFADKYLLAETVIREQFRQLVTATLPSSPRWDEKTLHALIQVLLDSFEHKYCHEHHPSLVLAPLLERAMYEDTGKRPSGNDRYHRQLGHVWNGPPMEPARSNALQRADRAGHLAGHSGRNSVSRT